MSSSPFFKEALNYPGHGLPNGSKARDEEVPPLDIFSPEFLATRDAFPANDGRNGDGAQNLESPPDATTPSVARVLGVNSFPHPEARRGHRRLSNRGG